MERLGAPPVPRRHWFDTHQHAYLELLWLALAHVLPGRRRTQAQQLAAYYLQKFRRPCRHRWRFGNMYSSSIVSSYILTVRLRLAGAGDCPCRVNHAN
ncbi:hypothetical protein DAI22_02g103300 [Oryza sativa Japonica Group]|nr:hypothetical protein DAI22_02g103300 [Oryza sativa Japonica Group]